MDFYLILNKNICAFSQHIIKNIYIYIYNLIYFDNEFNKTQEDL